MKIKPHLMMHVPKKLQEHSANLHCFHGERKHITTKGISESCSGPHFHMAVLRKGIAHDLAAMSRSRCVEIYLHEPVAEMPALAPFMKHFFGEGPYNDIPKASRSIGTKLGKIYHSEMMLFHFSRRSCNWRLSILCQLYWPTRGRVSRSLSEGVCAGRVR